MFFYELHVFFRRNDGYSIFVKTETNLSEDELIEYCVKNDKFEDESDAANVDYVNQLTETEYNLYIDLK